MDKNDAIRLDGMFVGAIAHLSGISYYIKDNMPAPEYAGFAKLIGAAMAELVEASSRLHAAFPDIVPKELKP